MACIPGQVVELPGSDVACETLTVRDCLTVAGVQIASGPWLPIEPTQTPPVFGWIQTVVGGRLNQISTINGGGTAVFPPAASVPNGTPIAIKLLDYSGSITLDPAGLDTIDGFPAGSGQLASYLDSNFGCVLCISNGVDGWSILRDSTGA